MRPAPLPPIDRPAARLLCVDPSGALLVQAVVDPAEPGVRRWVSPGGGIEPGESAHDAACREAWEELGLVLDDLGEPVVTMSNEFSFDGHRYLAHNVFFALRTARFAPVPRGMTEAELAFTAGVEWLDAAALDDLAAAGSPVAPTAMPAWLRDLHRRLPIEPMRPTVRVLVVDDDDRVLLMRFRNPTGGVWFPPGGGLEPGETAREAGLRELNEELGLTVSPAALGPVVWRRRHVLPAGAGGWDLREQWFLLRVRAGLALDRTGWTPLEVDTIDDLQWWTIDQIRRETGATFAPRALATLLPDLLDDERAGRLVGREPIEVGV